MDISSFTWSAEASRPVTDSEMRSGIESFFLYGEPPRETAADFVHLEELEERSRPSGWNIRSHAHAALAHVFFIRSGGGQMSADGVTTAFNAPVMLLIPERVVHSFTWQPETEGHVLTVSAACLARLQATIPELAGLFDAPVAISVPPESKDPEAIGHTLSRLNREISLQAPGRSRALEACLTTLLFDALRMRVADTNATTLAPRINMRLASRFMATLEKGFRRPRRISSYAHELGAGPAALRAATRAVTGRPPSSLLRERQMLEAKRLLLYSNISVAEAAYTLGFEDPAYFSRVFRNANGCSPRDFRRHHTVYVQRQPR